MPCRTATTVVPSHLKPFLVGSLLRQLADHLCEACGAQQQHRLSSKLDMSHVAPRRQACAVPPESGSRSLHLHLCTPSAAAVLTVLVGQGA